MQRQTFIYSVYDRKAQYYLPPFYADSNVQALRSFTEAVVTSDTDISRYPSDFDLVGLGHIDLITGKVTSLTHVDLIINGLVALQQAQEERRRYRLATQGGEQLDIEDSLKASPSA